MTFSDLVTPEPGERVVRVPQLFSYLLTPESPWTVIGKSVRGLEPHLGHDRGWPHWVTHEPLKHPGLGYGLIVVRDGWCYRGPTQWDGLA